jgi:hypothetical protein
MFGLRARIRVCRDLVRELYDLDQLLVLEAECPSKNFLLTHAPVILLVAEQAVEEDDGSIALLRIFLARLRLVLVVGQSDLKEGSRGREIPIALSGVQLL